ncbi:MAG TPA: electron transfer flavoprotein subunit alpha/FixB family protein [Thermoanaerobaculia bacterium]|nr:electron transfer flavoprotein subunit alpha/FixB family protein [Thermoanaerobaculia bacterium]
MAGGSGGVWVVLQQREGKLHRMSREAIAAGRRLAGAIGGRAEAVLLGSGLDELARQVAGFDLAAVQVADAPALAGYTPGAYVGALAPAIREAAPAYVVFPHTYQTVDYFARLAQETGSALLPEVTGFEAGEDGLLWRRPVLGGKLRSQVRVKGGGTVLVSVQSGAYPAEETGASSEGGAEVRPLPGDLAALRPDREILKIEQVAGEAVDLTRAEVIVAVGRGIGGPDKLAPVEELARALGAEIGASRPVIDNEWLPRDRQIGSSGQTVAPKLYLALGISGAIQHTVGMKGAGMVVAVNKDPNAPIFNLADYGIVADLHELVPALTAAVKEAKGS